MIHPESQDKNLQETSSDSVVTHYSLSGFIVNILVVLFWFAVLAYSIYHIGTGKTVDTKFFGPVWVITFNLFAFHLYALVDPEYTNAKEYQADLSVVNVLKNHWAVILGTVLLDILVFFYAVPAIFGAIVNKNSVNATIFITVCSGIYAVSGMICWGFITNNKKNILARIVRPWQSHEVAEASV